MTITKALKYKNIDWTEAQILLSHVLNKEKLFLLTHGDYSLTESEEKGYIDCVEKRLEGVPIAYITHKREFYGRDFYINENVLIPRPETELIIDVVKSLSLPNNSKVLDLCTGSGIIPITLMQEIDNIEVIGADISLKALEVARINAQKYGNNIIFIESDMFEDVPKEKYKVITANPPYIPTHDSNSLDEDVKREPSLALYGGADGLYFYRIILGKGKEYLQEKGFMVLEIGYNQKDQIETLACENGYKVVFFKDLQGFDRVALLCLNI
ncbi:MAG: peptide chain release factor N(5)-glutamine methyltransferase [Abditibacteriota bacterium]|nr:peptide chain release factor N(5)-glutamine methyltransferase [Abditibacteriota bacterium]